MSGWLSFSVPVALGQAQGLAGVPWPVLMSLLPATLIALMILVSLIRMRAKHRRSNQESAARDRLRMYSKQVLAAEQEEFDRLGTEQLDQPNTTVH